MGFCWFEEMAVWASKWYGMVRTIVSSKSNSKGREERGVMEAEESGEASALDDGVETGLMEATEGYPASSSKPSAAVRDPSFASFFLPFSTTLRRPVWHLPSRTSL